MKKRSYKEMMGSWCGRPSRELSTRAEGTAKSKPSWMLLGMLCLVSHFMYNTVSLWYKYVFDIQIRLQMSTFKLFLYISV